MLFCTIIINFSCWSIIKIKILAHINWDSRILFIIMLCLSDLIKKFFISVKNLLKQDMRTKTMCLNHQEMNCCCLNSIMMFLVSKTSSRLWPMTNSLMKNNFFIYLIRLWKLFYIMLRCCQICVFFLIAEMLNYYDKKR